MLLIKKINILLLYIIIFYNFSSDYSIINWHHKKRIILDPCLPVGLFHESVDDKGHAHHFKGTGDYNECRAALVPLLNQSGSCEKPFCSMNGIHQPDIDFYRTEFYGFSEFWYTMEDVYRIGGVYNNDKFNTEAKVIYSCDVKVLEYFVTFTVLWLLLFW